MREASLKVASGTDGDSFLKEHLHRNLMRATLSEVEKGTAGGKREELAYTKSFVLDLST